MTSKTGYEDRINYLNNRVSQLQKKLEKIKRAVNNGELEKLKAILDERSESDLE